MLESAAVITVRVDDSRCQGHTLCNLVAPHVFKLRDEDGHAYVESGEISDDLEGAAIRAMKGCPEGAISIER